MRLDSEDTKDYNRKIIGPRPKQGCSEHSVKVGRRDLPLSALAVRTMCAKHIGNQSPIISLDWISPLH